MDKTWVFWVNCTTRISGNKSSVGPFHDYDVAWKWMMDNRPASDWIDRRVVTYDETGEVKHTCVTCGSGKDVVYTSDPYAMEFYDNDTEDWFCARCLQQSADDI